MDSTLGLRGTDVARLACAIDEHIAWAAGDAVYLSGSVVEGMANTRSDFDVFLVTDREREGAAFGATHVLDVDGAAVDLEVWPRGRVDALLDRLAAMPGDAQRDPRDALALGSADLVFLHRLAIGVCLLGYEDVRRLQERVDRAALSRVLFDRAAAIAPGQAADVAGLLDDGDIDSACVSAQRLLGSALDAVLAVDGNTNPSEKWRLRRLRRHLERALAERLPETLRTLGSYEATRDLYLLRGWPGDDRAEALPEYGHVCARLARHAIPWGQRTLLGAPNLAPREGRAADAHANGGGDAPVAGPPLPRLTPDVMLRWRGEQLVLFTAGGSTEMEIGPVTAEALLHFDGRTSVGEATRQLVAGRPTDPAAMLQALADLRTVLAASGLVEITPFEPTIVQT